MKRARGTFWARAGILLLAIVFGVLVFWSIGFLMDDLKVFKMPDREAFFKARIDHSLQDRLEASKHRLEDLKHHHDILGQQRGFIKDASSGLQVLVDNLFKLKNRDQQLITESQFGQVLESLDKVIAIQDEFKNTAQAYLKVTEEQYKVGQEIAALERQIREEKARVSKAYSEVVRRQRIKTTVMRLALLIPLVVLSTFLFIKKRGSIYRSIYISTALALYLKTALVVHERFPSRYFKYILTVSLLLLVGWGFGWVVRRIAKPKLAGLLKQYRQAYERFLCPVCEYPIRRGPRKHLFWTRRTVNKTALDSGAMGDEEEPYVCPDCGTQLFEKCESCGAIRHSLLPNCAHCGAMKEISS